MLYPLPAVMVSVTDGDGRDNIITVAWTGTICTNPPMVYISVRPSRFSCDMIRKTGEFVINLTTEETDKFERMHLTRQKAEYVNAPLIAEAPVSIECKVTEEKPLGSHTMFMAKVLAVHAAEELMDEDGRLLLNKAGLLVYSHGDYLKTGKKLGSFGYSVKKQKHRKTK